MADHIQTYLSKILQSSEFQNSTKYQKLLEYLVKSTLAGKVPKEITIAMELFGVEMKDDTLGETNIRVYIHNVRKKLTPTISMKVRMTKYSLRFRKDDIRLSLLNEKIPVD